MKVYESAPRNPCTIGDARNAMARMGRDWETSRHWQPGGQSASEGELFWYITEGDANNGMPSWAKLSRKQRWQIITYLRVLGGSKPGSPRVSTSRADEAN